MRTTTENLIADLIERTKHNLNNAEALKLKPLDLLNQRKTIETWSALECIEHLNRYGDFYLPEIKKQIANSKFASEKIFKSGWLGNYFANSLLPKENLNKMKTFTNMNPIGSDLDFSTLEKFIAQQKQTLKLLQEARQVSLNKTKTGISISKWIKLKLGDTFRVVIYHNQRHLVQAQKAAG